MAFQMVVKGADELASALATAATEIDRNTAKAHRRSALLVQTTAKGLTPKRSGSLAESIRTSVDKHSAEVETDMVYAPPIHFGWSNRPRGGPIAPKPFMDGAVNATYVKVTDLFERGVDKALDGIPR